MDQVQQSEEDYLLRVEEVAKTLRLSIAKTYALAAQGEIPVVRIGRSVRVPQARFREWLRSKGG